MKYRSICVTSESKVIKVLTTCALLSHSLRLVLREQFLYYPSSILLPVSISLRLSAKHASNEKDTLIYPWAGGLLVKSWGEQTRRMFAKVCQPLLKNSGICGSTCYNEFVILDAHQYLSIPFWVSLGLLNELCRQVDKGKRKAEWNDSLVLAKHQVSQDIVSLNLVSPGWTDSKEDK